MSQPDLTVIEVEGGIQIQDPNAQELLNISAVTDKQAGLYVQVEQENKATPHIYVAFKKTKQKVGLWVQNPPNRGMTIKIGFGLNGNNNSVLTLRAGEFKQYFLTPTSSDVIILTQNPNQEGNFVLAVIKFIEDKNS